MNRTYYFFLVVICLSISCLLVEYNFLKVSLAAGKSEYHRQHTNTVEEKDEFNNGTYNNNIRATVTGEVEVENNFWESIDWNKKLDCGRYKCLFCDKTNEDVGYLIFNNHHSLGHQFQMEAIMSYKIAQYMKYTFGSKHLYLGPPTIVKMVHFANYSNSQSMNNNTVKGSDKNGVGQHYMYYANQYAIVQKVRIAPHPWIIVMPHMDSSKIKYFYRKKVTIRRSSFTSTLRNDTMSAIQALQNIPLLSHDYQIIIDGHGNLYQFDIDRIFLGGMYKESKNKFDKLFIKNYDKSMGMLRNILKWTSSPSSSHHHHHHGSNNNDDGDDATTEVSSAYYGRNGEEILSSYLNETSSKLSLLPSSSCHQARNIVKNMSGRILSDTKQQQQKRNVTRTAMLMMIHTVEMVIGKEEYSVGSSNETTNNILNYSLT